MGGPSLGSQPTSAGTLLGGWLSQPFPEPVLTGIHEPQTPVVFPGSPDRAMGFFSPWAAGVPPSPSLGCL